MKAPRPRLNTWALPRRAATCRTFYAVTMATFSPTNFAAKASEAADSAPVYLHIWLE